MDNLSLGTGIFWGSCRGIEKKLGEPTEIQVEDEVKRIYYCDQYNIIIAANAGEVEAMGIREVDSFKAR